MHLWSYGSTEIFSRPAPYSLCVGRPRIRDEVSAQGTEWGRRRAWEGFDYCERPQLVAT
jgi:hypothetical protein